MAIQAVRTERRSARPGNTAVMLGRYAAADLGNQSARGRAMGAVLAATTVGAVVGPNLLAPAGALAGTLGLVALTGPYLVAPVHLHHSGSGLAAIGMVISLHIAGMFAPSPLSGWVTDRLGPVRGAIAAGAVLVIASASAAIWAGVSGLLAAALMLLGVGWNVALLSGSALLTAGVPVGERSRREGWGEVGMGVAAAGGGVVAGPVMAGASYATLAAAGAIIATVILPIARWRSGPDDAAGGSA
jgi:MFS family permease